MCLLNASQHHDKVFPLLLDMWQKLRTAEFCRMMCPRFFGWLFVYRIASPIGSHQIRREIYLLKPWNHISHATTMFYTSTHIKPFRNKEAACRIMALPLYMTTLKKISNLVFVFESASPGKISSFSFHGSHEGCKVPYTVVRFLNWNYSLCWGRTHWGSSRILGPSILGQALKSRKSLVGV
jgi:hypothetical protein